MSSLDAQHESTSGRPLEITQAIEIELERKEKKKSCGWICIKSRLSLLFCPIRRWDTVYKECGDAVTHFEIHPEGFRMLFYLYFIGFMAFAIFVTTTWGYVDLEDNPILHRFGTNNVCIYFDDPPFNLFASTLWFPAQILLLSFVFFDYLRLRDHYQDGDDRYPVTKCFFVYYTASTLFESVAVICFGQIFATSPREHMEMHALPFFVLLCALWLLVLKRFLYLRKRRVVPWYGVLYVIVLCLSSAIQFGLGIPNLFKAKLWETHPWTTTLAVHNPWTTLSVFGPLLIYAVIGEEIDSLEITINRTNG